MFENKFKGKKVLITGHTGFKGSWLTLWLKHLGAEVYGVSIDLPSQPCHFAAAKIENEIEDHRLDIRDADALTALVGAVQPDFVFHLAAQSLVRRSYSDPTATWLTNTIGTVNMLEALRYVANPCVAIFVTSDKSYDNVEWEWGYRETDRIGGPDPYSASKGAAELAIRSYAESFFKPNGVVRLGVGRAGNVIGGGDWADDRIVADCMRAAASGKMVSLRKPLATRPWQHVLEPLSGYLTLAMNLENDPKLHAEPFNFGPPANQNHTVEKLVSMMSTFWDQIRWEDVSANDSGPNEASLLKLNCDKALHHLNWCAAWDFEATIRETALWYKNYYAAVSQDISEFSISQILSYTMAARDRGLVWAK